VDNVIQKINSKEVIVGLLSAVMNPETRIGYRRRLVLINRIEKAILNGIHDRQEEIKRKHCI